MKIYLASPYSYPNKEVEKQRFKLAAAAAGRLMQQGHVVYSPIVYGHSVAMALDLPTNWEFWQNQDIAFIDWCDLFVVLKLRGWERSEGIIQELYHAEKMGKPVEYIELLQKRVLSVNLPSELPSNVEGV